MAAGEHFDVCHAKKYLKADKLKIASFWQKKNTLMLVNLSLLGHNQTSVFFAS